MEFNVVPFGLSTSSAALIRALDYAIGDLHEFVIPFVDDLLCISTTFLEHIMRLDGRHPGVSSLTNVSRPIHEPNRSKSTLPGKLRVSRRRPAGWLGQGCLGRLRCTVLNSYKQGGDNIVFFNLFFMVLILRRFILLLLSCTLFNVNCILKSVVKSN